MAAPLIVVPKPKRQPYISKWALEHPIARYIKLVRSPTAGILLAQIVFWYRPRKTGGSKLRTFKQGYWWIAKTRDEWMYETGLSLEEYKRAVRLLEERKLIAVQQMPWNASPTEVFNVSHIRLLDKTLLSLSGVNHTTLSGGNDTTLSGVKDTTLYYREITERVTDRSGGEHASRADDDHEEQIGGDEGDKGVRRGGEEREVGEVEEVGEDNDILSALRDPRPTTPKGSCTVEPDSVTMDPELEMRAEDILKRPRTSPPNGALGAFWQRQVTDAFGGHQKPLTGQERGQLALIAKGLGPARARDVIAGTVAKWGKFATRVEQARATSSPPTPVIGFLLKHYDLAVDLLAEQTLVPPGADVGTSVQLSAAPMIPTPAPAETPYKLSDAEFAEIMKGFEK